MSAVRNAELDFGRPVRAVRLFGGAVSQRVDLRVAGVSAALLVLALLAGLLTLASGDYAVPLPQVFDALVGRASGTVQMVVVEWRLPRALLALLIGAALGIAGAIFQSLTRNPLGSPDIIGFSAGSFTGALIVISLVGSSYYQIAGGALAGGMATALVIYLLAYRGGVQGFRLIIVGIGVSAMLTSANIFMLLRANLQTAMSASIWSAGTLNGLGYERLVPVALILAVLIPLALAGGRAMRQLEMGDDAARAGGVETERTRLVLIALGVALTAVATAAAGPISFVALAAPQLAKRLSGAAGVAMGPAAAMGALLLVSADFVAQRAFAPTQLPVGVVTVSLGGLYFVWLLLREARRS